MWRSPGSWELKRSDQLACPQLPSAHPGPMLACAPIAIQPSAGTSSCSEVTLCMNGAPAAASNTVHQIDPRGGRPGRLWTVWRIQIPSGCRGETARR